MSNPFLLPESDFFEFGLHPAAARAQRRPHVRKASCRGNGRKRNDPWRKSHRAFVIKSPLAKAAPRARTTAHLSNSDVLPPRRPKVAARYVHQETDRQEETMT